MGWAGRRSPPMWRTLRRKSSSSLSGPPQACSESPACALRCKARPSRLRAQPGPPIAQSASRKLQRGQSHDAHHHFPRLRHLSAFHRPSPQRDLGRARPVCGWHRCSCGRACGGCEARGRRGSSARQVRSGQLQEVGKGRGRARARAEAEEEGGGGGGGRAAGRLKGTAPSTLRLAHTRAFAHKHSSRRMPSRTCARGSSAQQTSFWAQAAWPELGKVKCQKTLVSPHLQTCARLNARTNTLARNCRLAIHGTGPAATAALLVGGQCSEEAIALVRS